MSQKHKETLRAALANSSSTNALLLGKVYSAEEAATIAGCDTDTLASHTQEGIVPGLKWGRSWVYPALAFHLGLSLAALDSGQQRSKSGVVKQASRSRLAVKEPASEAATPKRASWRRTPPPLPSNSEAHLETLNPLTSSPP